MQENVEKPKGFENDLGSYGVCFYDSHCGEPVSWGFKIVNHLGEQRWAELGHFGDMQCTHGSYNVNWYLIVKELTKEEALEKYGPVTNLEVGPRGGFRSVTYGDKKFLSRKLDPRY